MTLQKAIEFLEKEYEKAKTLEHIHEPLPYALYKTWRYFDSRTKKGVNK